MTARQAGLVLGGSSGVGSAVAALMIGRGFLTAVASRRGSAPPGGENLHCDVRDPEAVREALQHAERRMGPLHWVVNAVGVGYFAPLRTGYADQWRSIVDTNILGLLHIISALGELERPVRHFVQIGSLAGSRPSRTPGNDVYSASKAAGALILARYREQLRAAGSDTKVTLVTPGFIGDTDFTGNYFSHHPGEEEPLLDRFLPLKPADVADVVAYALDAPANVELTELVVRPRHQPD